MLLWCFPNSDPGPEEVRNRVDQPPLNRQIRNEVLVDMLEAMDANGMLLVIF